MAKEMTIKISVSKRIQEDQFEPFEIGLESFIELGYDDNPKKVRKKFYKKLVNQLDELIEERLNELE